MQAAASDIKLVSLYDRRSDKLKKSPSDFVTFNEMVRWFLCNLDAVDATMRRTDGDYLLLFA